MTKSVSRRRKNQLHAVKISLTGGIAGVKGPITPSKLADFVLDANISSRIVKSFFKQISFHAKSSFSAMTEPEQDSQPDHGHRQKYLCNFTAAFRKGPKTSSCVCPITS